MTKVKFLLLYCLLTTSTLSICKAELSREQIFTSIYDNKIWASSESLSGGGSDIAKTRTTRMLLPVLVKIFNIEVFVDLGCGDFNWFKTLALDIKQYIGVDIVPSVIRHNIQCYSDRTRSFLCLDAVAESIPRGDLVLCKDVFQHLSLEDCKNVINNIKRSGARYLLATTYLATETNKDVTTGCSEPVNLFKPPFNFPEPLLLFREIYAEKAMFNKRQCLVLWEVNSLPAL